MRKCPSQESNSEPLTYIIYVLAIELLGRYLIYTVHSDKLLETISGLLNETAQQYKAQVSKPQYTIQVNAGCCPRSSIGRALAV